MKRTDGSLARRARPLFVVATLVCSFALAFTPGVPSAIALSSLDPSASAEPTQSPLPPEPTFAEPEPEATSSAEPAATLAPAPSANPAPAPTASPPSEPDPTPDPEPATTAAPPQDGPRAISLESQQGQHAVVADDPAYHLPTFTVETWLRRDAPDAGDPVGMSGSPMTTGVDGIDAAIPLVTRGDGRAAGRINWFLGLDARTGVLVADLQDRVDGTNHPIAGTTVLRDETWYHAAATYDGMTWRLYLNGRLEAELAIRDVRPETSGSAPVGLGSALSGDGTTALGAFDGALDETRIWSAARTAPEIRRDLGRATAAATPHLVASWSMDEGDGSVLLDGSGAHRDATLVGAPTWIDSPIPDDTIPPALDSVAALAGHDGVTVTWAAIETPDLAGYNVYRSTTRPVAVDREPLNGSRPVVTTSFIDVGAPQGARVHYAVTAVDRYGNESAASPMVTAPPDADAQADPVVPPGPAKGTDTEAPSTPMPGAADAHVDLTLASDAAADGRHRVDPGAPMKATVVVTTTTDLPDGRLVVIVPAGWAVTDNAGGTEAVGPHRVTWDLGPLAAGSTSSQHVGLVAPSVSPVDGGGSFESVFTAEVERPAGIATARSMTVLVAPRVIVEHAVLATVDPGSLVATARQVDLGLVGLERFEHARVRFQVRNADDLAVTFTPRLDFRSAGSVQFVPVPAGDGRPGVAFYVTREWVPIEGGVGGTRRSTEQAAIDVDDFVVSDLDGDDQAAVPGMHSMGLNPLPAMTIPGRSHTEIEFSIRATTDADYLAAYEFRMSDGESTLPGATTARVWMGAKPLATASGSMRQGVPVDDPAGATTPSGVAYRLVTPSSTDVAATPPLDGPHGPYALASDACAACHASHTAAGENLATRAAASSICFGCHSPTGSASSLDVQSEYADPSVPPNDPSTRTYYRHDALTQEGGHTLAANDEFGGVSNRHAVCADCHSPHAADSTNSVETAAGWTASGRLGRISGVAVTNSAVAGGTPTYTFLNGTRSPIGLEYQLCFKCHSGYTTLPSNVGFAPSRYVLDKAVEFNPANTSFHPIEAKGTNQSTAMAASLAGPSTYKQWNFQTTSTIRCQNCHGDDARFDESLPEAGEDATRAGDDLASHVSQPGSAAEPVPGILMQTYKFRELKAPASPYQAADFALCFMCHAEAPFLDKSGDARPDTDFRYHGLHVGDIANRGPSGTEIDKAGDGGGLATCAECHFRIHSTTYRVGGQDAYPRLVNFAPNVTADGSATAPVGANAWDPTAKTCTLTCHGEGHTAKGY